MLNKRNGVKLNVNQLRNDEIYYPGHHVNSRSE